MKDKAIIILSILLVSTFIFGFVTKKTETPRYDYLQIVERQGKIGISTAIEFLDTKIEGSKEGNLDASNSMRLIDEYNKQGYEVVSHSANCNAEGLMITNFYLLRKPR